MAELTEHRADAGHLEKHPLNAFIAAGGILRNEPAGLFREIKQDGAGFE